MKYNVYGIFEYHVILDKRNTSHPLNIKTQDVELIRRFLALKHRTTTANIKYVNVFPIYFEGYFPKYLPRIIYTEK